MSLPRLDESQCESAFNIAWQHFPSLFLATITFVDSVVDARSVSTVDELISIDILDDRNVFVSFLKAIKPVTHEAA